MEFRDRLKAWLDTPDNKRDYEEGALLLLKINLNQIMYRQNILCLSNPTRREFIAYELQKRYNFLLQEVTHEQVKEMQKKADEIAEHQHLEKKENPAIEFKKGKRADHDKLPKEIQQCYVENLDILHRMREVHLQLRNLSTDKRICPDNDRYPFLKELIDLDKKMHENWKRYDSFDGSVEQPKKTVKKKTVAKKTTGKVRK